MPFSHIALRTRDLAETRRFYMDLLGPREAVTGLDHFGIHVAPRRLPALRRRLEAAGVKVMGRRGRSSIYVKDPNGYTLEPYVD